MKVWGLTGQQQRYFFFFSLSGLNSFWSSLINPNCIRCSAPIEVMDDTERTSLRWEGRWLEIRDGQRCDVSVLHLICVNMAQTGRRVADITRLRVGKRLISRSTDGLVIISPTSRCWGGVWERTFLFNKWHFRDYTSSVNMYETGTDFHQTKSLLLGLFYVCKLYINWPKSCVERREKP